MSDKKNLEKAINFANKQNENALQWIKELKDEDTFYKKHCPDYIPIEKDTLRRIIFAFISIIIEHHKSIVELTDIRQSSALCLFRPLYEAYIKVYWLSLFENTEKIDKPIRKIVELNDNNSFPTLETMCKELDEKLAKLYNVENKEPLLKDLNNNKKEMHSYTHGGGYLLSTIINQNDVYTYQDMIDILNKVTYYLLNSISNLALIEKNPNIMLKVSVEKEKIYLT